MADDTPGGNGPGQLPDAIVLTVTFDPRTSQVTNVHGPIANKVLCYGILQGAMDVIRRYNPNRIVQPGALPPELLQRR